MSPIFLQSLFSHLFNPTFPLTPGILCRASHGQEVYSSLRLIVVLTLFVLWILVVFAQAN